MRKHKTLAIRLFSLKRVEFTMGYHEIRNYHTIFTRLTNEFRLRTDQAESVLQNMDRKQLLRLMYDISLEKSKIKNIGAYTAKILGI